MTLPIRRTSVAELAARRRRPSACSSLTRVGELLGLREQRGLLLALGLRRPACRTTSARRAAARTRSGRTGARSSAARIASTMPRPHRGRAGWRGRVSGSSRTSLMSITVRAYRRPRGGSAGRPMPGVYDGQVRGRYGVRRRSRTAVRRRRRAGGARPRGRGTGPGSRR